jgi:hypothetical protein
VIPSIQKFSDAIEVLPAEFSACSSSATGHVLEQLALATSLEGEYISFHLLFPSLHSKMLA